MLDRQLQCRLTVSSIVASQAGQRKKFQELAPEVDKSGTFFLDIDKCYSLMRDYVRDLRKTALQEPVVHFTTPLGHQAQVDFGTFRLPWGQRHALLVVLSLWLGEHEGATATAPPAGTAPRTGTSRTARARCRAP